MFKNLILILVVFASTISCKNEKSPQNFSINLKQNLILKFSDKLEIDKLFCLNKQNRDFFISDVSKVVISDNYLFILDNYSTQNIFVFDKNGSFVKKLGFVRDGGPESYLKLIDLVIDESKIIVIADAKVMFFDLKSLAFLYSKNLQTPIIKLAKLKDKYIAQTFEKNTLVVLDKNFNKQNSFLELQPIFSIQSTEPFSYDGKNLFFHRYFENNYYRISNNGVDTLSFKFKGFNNYRNLDLKKEIFNPSEIETYLINEVLTAEIYATQGFFVLNSRDVEPYLFFYNRKEPNKSFSILEDEKNWNKKKNSLTKDHSSPNIIGSTNNHLIAIIESEFLTNEDKEMFCDKNEFDIAIVLLKVK